MCKKYSGNNVYILEIHGCQYYVGCHTKKEPLSKNQILETSGNPLFVAHRKKLITLLEYKDCCNLVHIEEYGTPEEAKAREAELIVKFKELYGQHCLNQSAGNMYNQLGLKRSDKTKERMSNNLKNRLDQSKPIRQFTKDGQFIAEYPSIHEAERQTGIADIQISYCCKGRYKSAGKSIWKYA